MLCYMLNIFAAFLCVRAQSAVLFEHPDENVPNALLYLYKFGYIQFHKMSMISGPEDFLKEPIADFQAFAGINVSGVLDKETISLMKTPRYSFLIW